MKAGTIPPVVAACKCKHQFQDAAYGSGLRLHLVGGGTTSRNNKPIVHRCTVCGSETVKGLLRS